MNPEVFRFRLYVAGTAPNSMQAIANLTALCERHLPERHVIDIVDVVQDPAAALAEAIYMTPTVVCLSPNPGRRIVGTLSNPEPILQILGLGSNLRRSPGPKGSSRRPPLRRPV
jgi:circadian clock protein KaiB